MVKFWVEIYSYDYTFIHFIFHFLNNHAKQQSRATHALDLWCYISRECECVIQLCRSKLARENRLNGIAFKNVMAVVTEKKAKRGRTQGK